MACSFVLGGPEFVKKKEGVEEILQRKKSRQERTCMHYKCVALSSKLPSYWNWKRKEEKNNTYLPFAGYQVPVVPEFLNLTHLPEIDVVTLIL